MKTLPYLALVWLLSLACSLTGAPVAGASVDLLPTQTVVTVVAQTATSVPTLDTCRVTASVLQLRECAGTSCTVKAWLKQGDALSVHQNVDGWFQVTSPAGESGWVNSKYCGGL
ncbi:MAG: SH3 domain-containing protein [Chloroflexota bacterium]